MSIDVTVSETILAPRDEVARYVMDQRNDTTWIGGITESQLLGRSDEPFGIGSDVRRVASFMGKRIEYVNRVIDLEPGRLLAMRSVKAPFPMEVTYVFDDRAGGTHASIRVQGEPGAMYKVAAPLLARRVRRSVSSDLATLKRLLERSSGTSSAAR